MLYKASLFSTFSTVVSLIFCTMIILAGMGWCFMVLIRIFLVICNVEHFRTPVGCSNTFLETTVSSGPFPLWIGLFGFFFGIVWVPYVYFGYYCLIKHLIIEYFLPSSRLFFQFVSCFFCCDEAFFSCVSSHLFVFAFIACALGVIKSLPAPLWRSFSPVFSWWSFVVEVLHLNL